MTDDELPARDQTQSRLRISELRYRRLFEAARDGILILDAVTLKITDVNSFMTELLGYSLGNSPGDRSSRTPRRVQIVAVGSDKWGAISRRKKAGLARLPHL